MHGEVSYILPCLGRIEIDQQASGPQAVAMEDSTGCMHGSRGQVKPASPDLLSEPKIIAELAKAAAPSRFDYSMGRLGGRLRQDTQRNRRDLSRHLPRLQRADVAAGRLPSPARRTAPAVEDQDRQGQFHHAEIARRPTSTRRPSSAMWFS